MASRSSERMPRKHENTKQGPVYFFVLSCFRGCVIFLLWIACGIVLAQVPDRARTEALARRATERLQSLQREAERLAAEERSLLNDVKKLEIERQIRAEELKRVDTDAARVQAELDATGARAAALERTSRDEA